MFPNMVIIYGEELLALCPPKLEDLILSVVRDSYSVYLQLSFMSGGRHPQSQDAHAVVTGTHLSRIRTLWWTKFAGTLRLEFRS